MLRQTNKIFVENTKTTDRQKTKQKDLYIPYSMERYTMFNGKIQYVTNGKTMW